MPEVVETFIRFDWFWLNFADGSTGAVAGFFEEERRGENELVWRFAEIFELSNGDGDKKDDVPTPTPSCLRCDKS